MLKLKGYFGVVLSKYQVGRSGARLLAPECIYIDPHLGNRTVGAAGFRACLRYVSSVKGERGGGLLSQQDLLSSTYTIYPNLAARCGQDVTNRGSGTLQSGFQKNSASRWYVDRTLG